MASSITRFDIEKFDGKNEFGLWQINMRALMVQQGCNAALETLPADLEAGKKAALMKKAYQLLDFMLGRPGTKLGDHIDEFYKLILDLANIDIKIEDKDETLMDVLATLNSRELKKRTEGTMEEIGDGVYVREVRSFRGSPDEADVQLEVKWFVKKGKRDQNSDSSDDKGNAYFGEALVVVKNDEMTELVIDSSDNRTCTIKGTRKVKIQLLDGSSFILKDVRIKVIKGCRVMMTGIMKKNCVYTLEVKVMTFDVQKHKDSKQVGFKQLGSKQVGFKQLGVKQVGFKLGSGFETGVHGVQVEKRVWFEVELQGAQGDCEAEVFQVSHDDAAVAQKRLKDKQL
ncbi:hypothetical protein Tco_0005021 [Tanacetum coccineum]